MQQRFIRFGLRLSANHRRAQSEDLRQVRAKTLELLATSEAQDFFLMDRPFVESRYAKMLADLGVGGKEFWHLKSSEKAINDKLPRMTDWALARYSSLGCAVLYFLLSCISYRG